MSGSVAFTGESNPDGAKDSYNSGVFRASHRHGDRTTKYWRGVVGSTWWFYFTGDSTNELWEAYIEHCQRMLENPKPDLGLICVAHKADSPTAAQRKMIGDFIKSEAERLKVLKGFALVLDSPLHILALKAINWIVSKPFEEGVFAMPSTAATWLHDRGTHIDAETLFRAFKETVPAEHLWLD